MKSPKDALEAIQKGVAEEEAAVVAAHQPVRQAVAVRHVCVAHRGPEPVRAAFINPRWHRPMLVGHLQAVSSDWGAAKVMPQAR